MSDYLVKTGRKHPSLAQASDLDARFVTKTRPTGKTFGGMFVEVESAGHDRTAIYVNAPVGATAVRADGGKMPSRQITTMRLGDVDKMVRRIGDDDARAVEAIDASIREHQEAIKRHRRERAQLLAKAFRRGRKVYAGELRDKADAHLSEGGGDDA